VTPAALAISANDDVAKALAIKHSSAQKINLISGFPVLLPWYGLTSVQLLSHKYASLFESTMVGMKGRIC